MDFAGKVIIIGIFLSSVNSLIRARATEILGFSLRQMFYESIMKKSISFFDVRKSGDICKFYSKCVTTLI